MAGKEQARDGPYRREKLCLVLNLAQECCPAIGKAPDAVGTENSSAAVLQCRDAIGREKGSAIGMGGVEPLGNCEHDRIGKCDRARQEADHERDPAEELHRCEQGRPEPARIKANALDESGLREWRHDLRPTVEDRRTAHEHPQDEPVRGLGDPIAKARQPWKDKPCGCRADRLTVQERIALFGSGYRQPMSAC